MRNLYRVIGRDLDAHTVSLANQNGKVEIIAEGAFMSGYKKVDNPFDIDTIEYILYTKDEGDDTYEDTYDIEFVDGQSHSTYKSNLYYDEVVELLGEEVANQMKSEGSEDENRIEIGNYSRLYTEPIDLHNPDEVNRVAKKLFRVCSDESGIPGWILTDGTRLDLSGGNEFEPRAVDHNCVGLIPGIRNRYDFIALGNIRLIPEGPGITLAKEPTMPQELYLRYWLEEMKERGNKSLYVDILDENGNNIDSYTFNNPIPRVLLNELTRYFRTGMKLDDNIENREDY